MVLENPGKGNDENLLQGVPRRAPADDLPGRGTEGDSKRGKRVLATAQMLIRDGRVGLQSRTEGGAL